jgi:hypothetical protein
MLHKISSLRSYRENFIRDQPQSYQKQLISSTKIGLRNFKFPITDLPISPKLSMLIGLSTQ